MEDEEHELFEKGYSKRSVFRSKLGYIVLLVIIAVLLVVSIGAIVGAGVSINHSLTKCTTAGCVELAATVISNMDPSVDPCEDFYNYSCGGWEKRNVIPSGQGTWGVFNELNSRNLIQLKKLIEGNVNNDIKAISVARQLYQSCMDIDSLTKSGADLLVDIINLSGGWSVVDNSSNGMET